MRKKIKVHIDGMHCGSCEVMIEQAWKKLPDVLSVSVNSANGYAEMEVNRQPTLDELNLPIKEHGYNAHFIAEVSSGKKKVAKQEKNINSPQHINPKDKKRIIGIIAIVLGFFWLSRRFGWLPDIGVTDSMSYGFILLIGLVASMSTCLATTGGLLVAITAKFTEAHPELKGFQRFRPHIYFNIGRIISYTVLGGVVGAVGSILTLSPAITGLITIVASLVMVLLGFQMLSIFPSLRRFQPKMPKTLAHKIHDLSGSNKKSTPFILGAATFFLPCGFTQALQLYALSTGSASIGALTMFFFALGTVPALVSLGAVTSFSKGRFQLYFTQIVAVLIILVGFTTVRNGWVLLDSGSELKDSAKAVSSTPVSDPNVRLVNGVQVMDMKIDFIDYLPHKFTVKKGVPVQWNVDSTEASGCMRSLLVPGLRINEYLGVGKKTVRFTPTKTGVFKFSCSMGMGTYGAAITVVE